MEKMISREAALALLRQYNQEPFHIRHALTVEAVMRWFANDLGYGKEADFWAMCGLLHDIDFEKWPEQHCVKAPELLRPAGVGDDPCHMQPWPQNMHRCGPRKGDGKGAFRL